MYRFVIGDRQAILVERGDSDADVTRPFRLIGAVGRDGLCPRFEFEPGGGRCNFERIPAGQVVIAIVIDQGCFDGVHPVGEWFLRADHDHILVTKILMWHNDTVKFDADGIGEHLLPLKHPRAALVQTVHHANLDTWRFGFDCGFRRWRNQNAFRKPGCDVTRNSEKIAVSLTAVVLGVS